MFKPLVMTLLIISIVALAAFYILHFGETSGAINTHITTDILNYIHR